MALTDSYLIQYEPRFLSYLRSDSRIRVSDYSDRFLSWQQQGPYAPAPSLDIEVWLESMGAARSAESLLACDTILTPWEYEPCLLPLSEDWRRFIAADLIDWTINQFDAVDPDVVICVERRRLATAAAQVISDARGIPMLCLTMARVGNRWVVRQDLGYGTSDRQLRGILAHQPSETATLAAKQFVDRVRRGEPAYDSPSTSALWAHRLDSFTAWQTYAIHLASWGRQLLGRHLRGGSRTQVIKSRRYEQAFARMSLHEARVEWNRLSLILRQGPFRRFSVKALGEMRYVYWPLHSRPEDANSALGDGLDEQLLAVDLAARLHRKGVYLVAKENPLMLGWRSPTFYKRLRRAGVLLASPDTPSASLYMNSMGVAGLSGTALLEGAIVGVPTLAFGHPEFEACLNYQGLADVDAFVDSVAGEGKTAPARLSPERYLSWIFSRSDDCDLPFLSPLDTPKGARMAESVSRRFWEALEEARL
jgi:hypothetical protein